MAQSDDGSRFRWLVVGLWLVVVALLAGLSAFSADTLSAARAYVGGESHWSKGQKDAIYHLYRYSESHDALDYRRHLAALAVSQGDRLARLELDKPVPDMAVVRRGLLQGGNHADDIDSMARLYRRFRHVGFMAEAIRTWAEGDAQMDELSALGRDMHARILAGDNGSPQLRSLVRRIPALSERLTELGMRFSGSLGEASRITRQLVTATTLGLGALLAAASVWLTMRMHHAQRRTEQALRESDERLATAAEGAHIGVFDWDVEHDRVQLDARAAAHFGVDDDPGSRNGTQLSADRVDPADLPALHAALARAVNGDELVELRFRVLWRDGRVRHLEMNARRRQADGRRAVGLLWDVSDDVEAEQLRLDKEAAERANLAKTQFLSRVSHELRTPLNAVLGFAQLLQTDAHEPLTSRQAARLQHVLDSGQHLLELINDLLDLTSIEDGALALSNREVPLAPALGASLRQVEPLALSMGVTLAIEGAQALAVHADPRRLEQVFATLLSNAVRYNRPGGRAWVVCAEEGARVVVTVHDTGVGIEAGKLAQLYQPFNRLGAENTPVPGSGLGLVITRLLLQRMGATMAIESEVGRGTRVRVSLPLARVVRQETALEGR